MPSRPNRIVIGDTVHDITEPYRAGARAMRRGTTWHANPYRHGSRRHEDWDRGHTHEAAGEHFRFGRDLVEAAMRGEEFAEDAGVPRDADGQRRPQVDKGSVDRGLIPGTAAPGGRYGADVAQPGERGFHTAEVAGSIPAVRTTRRAFSLSFFRAGLARPAPHQAPRAHARLATSAAAPARLACGHSSAVEHLLAKQEVAGSTPAARSISFFVRKHPHASHGTRLRAASVPP